MCRKIENLLKKQAFTLIEVLVVIAVIFILGLLLTPIFRQARESGESARCIANIRTCGNAILVHASENGGRLVLPYASKDQVDIDRFPELDGHPQTGTWYEYLESLNLLSLNATVCPSLSPFHFESKPWGRTYGMRRRVDTLRYRSIVLADEERPESFVLLADSSRPNSTPVMQWYYISWKGHPSIGDKIHFRHNHKANILFLDGSVRAMTPDQVLELEDGWNEYAFDLEQH